MLQKNCIAKFCPSNITVGVKMILRVVLLQVNGPQSDKQEPASIQKSLTLFIGIYQQISFKLWVVYQITFKKGAFVTDL